jgi:hypothetical protein
MYRWDSQVRTGSIPETRWPFFLKTSWRTAIWREMSGTSAGLSCKFGTMNDLYALMLSSVSGERKEGRKAGRKKERNPPKIASDSLAGGLLKSSQYGDTVTSGPFGVSMSAAARPKRWGVFRQAKGREYDPSRFELFTLFT